MKNYILFEQNENKNELAMIKIGRIIDDKEVEYIIVDEPNLIVTTQDQQYDIRSSRDYFEYRFRKEDKYYE